MRPTVVVSSLAGGFPYARCASASVPASRLCYAGVARTSTLHAARSASLAPTALPVDDASSPLRVAVPGSWRNGPSACSSSCVAVDSSSTCPCYR